MEAKTLTPDAGGAAPGTLAAGELVWAKPKGRRGRWWPARLLAACPAGAAGDVSYFGDPGAPPGPAAHVRRFGDPGADGMARSSAARGFLAGVEEAHAGAVAALRASLTCGCAPPPSTEAAAGGLLVFGVANMAPAEFLTALRDAALGGSSAVGLVDRARLKSWARVFGEGWGPGGPGRYPRRPPEDLVDKIDLDVPAAEDREADEWLADAEDEHKASEEPQQTPGQKKRRAAALTDELDAGEDDDKNDSATGTGTSGKRERKRSKYLSPPYTNLGVFMLPRKAADFPKAVALSAAEHDSKVLPDSILVEEVLSLVQGFGKDVRHGSRLPKAVESFLSSFRSSQFKCPDTASYEVHGPPEAHVVGEVGASIASGAVSDAHAVLKQGKCASKRSRKKDDNGSANSSIKRKKREKSSPAPTFGCDLPITPAIPIRQVKAEDLRSPVKPGGGAMGTGVGVKDEKFKPSMFKCAISAAIPVATKPGQDQVQANDGSVVQAPLAVDKTLSDQSAKENDEAMLGDEKSKPSLFKCPISAAVPWAAKHGQEQVQPNDGSSGKTSLALDNTLSDQSAKESDEAKFGDEKSKSSLFKCPNSAAVPGATKPGHEQIQLNEGTVGKTPQAVDNALSGQFAKENNVAKLGDEKSEPSVLECPVSAAVPGTTKAGQGQVELNDGSVGKTLMAAGNALYDQSAEEIDEAKLLVTKSEMDAQSINVDLPAGSVRVEAKESEAKVCIDDTVRDVVADLPVKSFRAEAVESAAKVCTDDSVQTLVVDLPVRSVLEEAVKSEPNICIDETMQSVGADMPPSSGPSPMDGSVSLPIDENKEHASVEVQTVQQSYASLQAMVPEILKEGEVTNGTDVIAVNHAPEDEGQKDEHPDQKGNLTAAAAINHSFGVAVNGTCPDPTNSTHKKKKKKATQVFKEPAAIIVEFTPGVIIPSREELLSAFGKFDILIDSQTDISKATRSARVVFGEKAEAEKAYKRAEFLGEFGPPFATLKLVDLPPIELSVPSPPPSLASKPPLKDVRKNLEQMILARRSSLKKATSADGLPVQDKLLAEMEGLLAQVGKMLSRSSTSTPP